MSGERGKREDREEDNVDRVLHEIDGIQEYDNKLPNWWLYTLYGSIAFGVVYWWVYHSAGVLDLPLAAYNAESDRLAAEQAAQTPVGEATDESLLAMTKDDNAMALGKQVFGTMCVACHRADGGGGVGPNLTDPFWLHGGGPEKVYKSIATGIPDKGMPAWEPQLGALKTQAVTAWVISMRDTNVPGGKAAQGEEEPLTLH